MINYLRRSIVLALFFLVFFGLCTASSARYLPGPLQAPGRWFGHGRRSTLIGRTGRAPSFFHGRPDDFGPYAGTGDNPLVANGKNGESQPQISATFKVLLAFFKA